MGMMKPDESIVRGELTSVPSRHCRQFTNCFAEDILKFSGYSRLWNKSWIQASLLRVNEPYLNIARKGKML